MDKQYIESRFKELSEILKKEMNDLGFWTGRLSSSALATSVSIVMFKLSEDGKYGRRIENGLNWLFGNVNNDGGFGDSPESESNVSTSLLCYAAVYFCDNSTETSKNVLRNIENYLGDIGISIHSGKIAESVLKFYGKDLTFSVPILSMLSICGILDEKGLKRIPQLPFELSLLPDSWYRFFNLQVVSYAVPALIAVGIYLFRVKKSKNAFFKLIRMKSVEPALKKLESIMPESGGFLEAIPLTAFSAMCLISAGFRNNPVVNKAFNFLENQQREDGSWPIDTDLSTWVTTLSVKALGPAIKDVLNQEQTKTLKNHLLRLQCKENHPFNMAKPGGWGWTSFSGSVPDADDTPGAILALLEMYEGTLEETISVLLGCVWLLQIQNRDGGIPTFCKGWGRLPFDRSCADLTGHCLLAWFKSIEILGDRMPNGIRKQVYIGIKRVVSYLRKHQDKDGSWVPLWFGSQLAKNKQNPVYGTSKVNTYIADCLRTSVIHNSIREVLQNMKFKAELYLKNQQNDDGSWGAFKGAEGTIEETALAICAQSDYQNDAVIRAINRIEKEIAEKGIKSNPIGLYFASLWYDEKMYPIIFYTEALRRILFNSLKSNN